MQRELYNPTPELKKNAGELDHEQDQIAQLELGLKNMIM